MKNNEVNLNMQPLREQVCDYLKRQIGLMNIHPGEKISLRKVSQELGISVTPLRDALLQLEGEGMVTIMPRKGIVLREFTLKDIEGYYEIIAMLECRALETAIHKITKEHTDLLHELNTKCKACACESRHGEGRIFNQTFHEVYLALSDNPHIRTIWLHIWPKLYYCPTNIVHTLEWDMVCVAQHESLTVALEHGDIATAIRCIRDEHWSFAKQKEYIIRYYDL